MKEILVAFDFSAYSQRALCLALQGLPFGLETNVTLLHVMDPGLYESVLPGRRLPTSGDISRFLMAEVAKATFQKPKWIIGDVKYEVAIGSVVPTIAARANYDGLLLGGQGHGGLTERVLGTTARRLLRTTELPTYVVKNAQAKGSLRNVLCAIDMTPQSEMALRAAEAMRAHFATSFDVLMVGLDEVWPYEYHLTSPAGAELEAMRAKMRHACEESMRKLEREKLGQLRSRRQIFMFGSPARTVARVADDYEAVIVGANRGVLNFGSVLTGLLELSTADVFVAC